MARRRNEKLAAQGAQVLIEINRSRGVETDDRYVRLAARAPQAQRRQSADSDSDERPHIAGAHVAVLGVLTAGLAWALRPQRGRSVPEVRISASAHPVMHLLHDAGVAAWFGGSLMGATSLNAAAAELDDPRQRARASTAGWSRWAPVNAAAVAAHVIGGTGLLITDSQRVATREGVGRSMAIKTLATGAALGTAAWSAALNRRMAAAGDVPVKGATEPGAGTPPDVAQTMKQLKVNQWLNPLISGTIIVLGAWHEEQQRTSQVVPGVIKGVAGRPAVLVPALAATAVGVIASRRSHSKSRSNRTTAYPSTTVTPMPTTTISGTTGTTGTTGMTGTTSTTSAGTTADVTAVAPLGATYGTDSSGHTPPPTTF